MRLCRLAPNTLEVVISETNLKYPVIVIFVATGTDVTTSGQKENMFCPLRGHNRKQTSRENRVYLIKSIVVRTHLFCT